MFYYRAIEDIEDAYSYRMQDFISIPKGALFTRSEMSALGALTYKQPMSRGLFELIETPVSNTMLLYSTRYVINERKVQTQERKNDNGKNSV